MTKKADFNAEEWSLVVQGPALAGMMLVTAERGGMLRETVSMAKAYAEAREDHGASELLDEIVSSPPMVDQAQPRSREELLDQGAQHLREAVAVLEAHATPAEVDDYQRFVVALSNRVAHAHREGGFLGVGGHEVSDREQAALDEVAAALSAQRS